MAGKGSKGTVIGSRASPYAEGTGNAPAEEYVAETVPYPAADDDLSATQAADLVRATTEAERERSVEADAIIPTAMDFDETPGTALDVTQRRGPAPPEGVAPAAASSSGSAAPELALAPDALAWGSRRGQRLGC